jgi:thiol-disulfide isomerase/thioredoxin
MKFGIKKAAAIVVLSLVFNACSDGAGVRNHIVLNGESPLVTKFSAADKTLNVGDKPFMLFFFSTTCGVCKEEIPYINALLEKYDDRVDIIGVMNGGQGFDKDMEIIKAKNANFRVVTDAKSVAYLANAVGGVFGSPVVYTYDKNGKLSEKFLGLTPQKVLEEGIKKVL